MRYRGEHGVDVHQQAPASIRPASIVGYRLHLSRPFRPFAVALAQEGRPRSARARTHTPTAPPKAPTFKPHTSDMLGFVRIESIESVGVEATYDIEVEGHHNFVAEGFVVHNSEVVYHRNREDLAKQGILFCDMDTALREYPELVKKYFGTIIPPGDNKFAALNTAVWSGGSFIYVPPGVNCEMPLQAYFRINSENAGQFERTLIIADEGSQVHYIEGCSAPVYTTDSLHSAVVEIIVKPSARGHYTTIQNWSPNVYNLVTKRARVEAEGHMEWIDGNIGSQAHHEVPGGVPRRPEGHRRSALGRLRRCRPAPGRGRQDGARRARDHLEDRVEVDLQGRRHHHVPRPRPSRGGCLRLQEPRAVRRVDP